MISPEEEPSPSVTRVCAPPDRNPRPPRLALPPLSCDCHAHIFGPAGTHPYIPDRAYTPPDALLPDYLSVLATLGVERSVLVQPSVYGNDNSVLLDALARSPVRSRGVVSLDDSVSDYRLRSLDAEGVRGVRYNLVDGRDPGGELPLERLRWMSRRVRTLGWHVELLLHVDDYPDLDRLFRAFPGDLVLAHMGFPRRGYGLEDAGVQELLRLLDRGNTWVKLTAPYRLSTAELPYEDLLPLVQLLVAHAPERLLWGSDWPHVCQEDAMPNDGDLCDLLLRWLPDPALRERVLADNPNRLYRF